MKMGVSRENIINLSFESIKAIVVQHFKLCSLECNFNAVKVMKLTVETFLLRLFNTTNQAYAESDCLSRIR